METTRAKGPSAFGIEHFAVLFNAKQALVGQRWFVLLRAATYRDAPTEKMPKLV